MGFLSSGRLHTTGATSAFIRRPCDPPSSDLMTDLRRNHRCRSSSDIAEKLKAPCLIER